MDFRAATAALMAEGVTLEEIAQALGVAYTTARAYRLEPSSTSFRAPPDGWEPALAKLAKTRGRALAKLAKQLEEK
jgi:hypothetical protein